MRDKLRKLDKRLPIPGYRWDCVYVGLGFGFILRFASSTQTAWDWCTLVLWLVLLALHAYKLGSRRSANRAREVIDKQQELIMMLKAELEMSVNAGGVIVLPDPDRPGEITIHARMNLN